MQLIPGNCLYLRPSEGLVLKTSTNISLSFLLRFWIVSILSCWSPQAPFLARLPAPFLAPPPRSTSGPQGNICGRGSQGSPRYGSLRGHSDTAFDWSDEIVPKFLNVYTF